MKKKLVFKTAYFITKTQIRFHAQHFEIGDKVIMNKGPIRETIKVNEG